MDSITQLANGTCGFSRDTLAVYKLHLVKIAEIIYRVYMLMDVPPHSNPPEVSLYHVDSLADSLMAFPIMKL